MPENRVLELFRGGAQPNEVKKAVQWSALAAEEREQLFQEAEKLLDDPKGYDFLVMLYMLTHPGFPWDTVRVLSLVTRRRSIPAEKKVSTLTDIRRNLDRIRDMLSSQPGRDSTQLERYKHFEADYYVLYGNVQLDNGKPEDALRNYELALEGFQKLGAQERVELLRQKMAGLHTMQQKSEALVPLQDLRDERDTLSQAISELEGQRQAAQVALVTAQARLKEIEASQKNAQAQLEAWAKEIRLRQHAAQEAAGQLKALQEQTAFQRQQIDTQAAALRLLTSLARRTSAPLWVEVLRLALAQGQVDNLMLQVMDRLTLDCPPEALPVIAELTTRTLQPGLEIPDGADDPIAQGFALMAKLQQDLPTEERAAGLLKAWDLILSSEPVTTHA